MINNYPEGGLKMIDILSFNKALKATWIKKYLDTGNQGKWKFFFDLELKKFECTLPFTSNLNKIDTANIFKTQDSFLKGNSPNLVRNQFWREYNISESVYRTKLMVQLTYKDQRQPYFLQRMVL